MINWIFGEIWSHPPTGKHNIEYFLDKSNTLNLPIYNKNSNVSPIQLLVFNNEILVTKIFTHAYQKQILIGKICYPTVKKTAPRIRISLSAQHTITDIELLCNTLHQAIN